MNDTCQNRQPNDCTNVAQQSFQTPGNCCFDCTETESNNNPKTMIDDKTNVPSKTGSRSCSFSLSESNTFVKHQHGSTYLMPKEQFNSTSYKNTKKMSCQECSCNDGTHLCNNSTKTECPLGQTCLPYDFNKPFDISVCCPPCAGKISLSFVFPNNFTNSLFCKACMEENIFHLHGSSWESITSKCKECTCNNSQILCHQYSCSPVSCKDNEIVDNDGCCPKCVCSSDFHCPFGRVVAEDGVELCVCNTNPLDETTISSNIPEDAGKKSDLNMSEIILYCSRKFILKHISTFFFRNSLINFIFSCSNNGNICNHAGILHPFVFLL